DWFSVATCEYGDDGIRVIERSDKTDNLAKARRYMKTGTFERPEPPKPEPKKQWIPKVRPESRAEQRARMKQAMQILKPQKGVRVCILPETLTPEMLENSRKAHKSLVNSILVTSKLRKKALEIQLHEMKRRSSQDLIIMV